jgi:hypothetical protein
VQVRVKRKAMIRVKGHGEQGDKGLDDVREETETLMYVIHNRNK